LTALADVAVQRGSCAQATRDRYGKSMTSPLVFGVLPVTIAFAIFPGVFVLQVGF
jgi:hypothetical protein